MCPAEQQKEVLLRCPVVSSHKAETQILDLERVFPAQRRGCE